MMLAHCFLLVLEAIKWPSKKEKKINPRINVSIFRHHCLWLLWFIFFSINAMPQDSFQFSSWQLRHTSVVSKQVKVGTILASVECTGSWLHANTCPVFVRWVVLEILHDIVQTHLFILRINQLVYFMKKKQHEMQIYLNNFLMYKHWTSTS